MSYGTTSTQSPPSAIPIGAPIRSRRASIFDAGGPNSISEFVGSYSRMQSHMQNLIVPQDEAASHSPRLSFDDNAPSIFPSYGAISDENSIFNDANSVFNDASIMSGSLVPGDLEDQLLSRNRLYSSNSRITGKGDDGTLIIGRSTAPQTIFNSINILIGVGLYSLSYGFKYSGLVYGVLLLALCGVVTNYSALLIGRCLKSNSNLFSYGDIARHCYGDLAFIGCVISFSLDLIGAAVALIILFSDSFHTFYPNISSFTFSIIYCFIILGLSLLPLNILSNLSFVGIVCTSGTVLVCIIAGFSKPSGQGSLLSPSEMFLWPEEYKYLLVSLGIFLALFGGHAVFPELYRDMRHPQKFGKSITIAFSFTITLDMTAALIGYIMFGNDVAEILTNSIMKAEGYASWIPTTLCLFLGLVPLTKGPLVIRPVSTVLDQYFNVHTDPRPHNPIKIMDKAIIIFIAFLIANLCTSFAQVMAVMGSLICFTICITLPFLFYYKMFYDELSHFKRLFFEISIGISLVLTVAGTYCALVY
ncbi:Avt1 protein [Saccharomycopsis crataegensis]|uniref:Avt1 protein n=1 Tax=Saccharomycopsis crataegensis TaxID=43959 RepID=A0AAV5QJM5_9ASCO|nr:Avt1 protein [Saccharomycopsis crataegensis]